MAIKASEALGNIESFVDMMSAASGIPTYKLEGWLNVYFTLRVVACLEEDTSEDDGRIISAPTAGNEPVSLTVEPTEDAQTPLELKSEAEPEKKLSGNGARFKREIHGRLVAARAGGITIANIVAASYGGLKDDDIIQALNCQHLHHSKWTAIGAALESLGF